MWVVKPTAAVLGVGQKGISDQHVSFRHAYKILGAFKNVSDKICNIQCEEYFMLLTIPPFTVLLPQ
jgi:hypothetical protein